MTATGITILFHSDAQLLSDAVRVAFGAIPTDDPRWGYHMATICDLDEEELVIVRDAIYDALAAVGHDIRMPNNLRFEQERDDPRVYHLIPPEGGG